MGEIAGIVTFNGLDITDLVDDPELRPLQFAEELCDLVGPDRRQPTHEEMLGILKVRTGRLRRLKTQKEPS